MVFVYIAIAVSLLGLIFVFSSSKIKFRSKLWLIYGKKGSGKSTLLVKVAMAMLKDGRNVYSTDPIKGTLPISPYDYFKYRYPKGSVVLIDELGMVHDSREFKNFESQCRDWYKLQRHLGIMVVACSQTADVDKKIRDLADYVSICRGVTNLISVVRFYDRRIVVARHGDGNGGTSKGSEIVDDVFPVFFLSGFLFTAGWKYWKFFDSYAVPDWPMDERDMPEPPQFFRPVERMKGLIRSGLSRMKPKKELPTENIAVKDEIVTQIAAAAELQATDSV